MAATTSIYEHLREKNLLGIPQSEAAQVDFSETDLRN